MSLYDLLIAKVSELALSMSSSLNTRGFKRGGSAGQMPVKLSNDDFDWDWADPATVSLTWSEIADKPAWTGTFDGSYSSLSGKPTLGDASALNVGTTAGTVAAGNHSHLSADIGDATETGEAGKLVKIASNGQLAFQDPSTLQVSAIVPAPSGDATNFLQMPNGSGTLALTSRTDGIPDAIIPANAATARTNLGAGAVGDAIFQTATVAAANNITHPPVVLGTPVLTGSWQDLGGGVYSNNTATASETVTFTFSGLVDGAIYLATFVTTRTSGAVLGRITSGGINTSSPAVGLSLSTSWLLTSFGTGETKFFIRTESAGFVGSISGIKLIRII